MANLRNISLLFASTISLSSLQLCDLSYSTKSELNGFFIPISHLRVSPVSATPKSLYLPPVKTNPRRSEGSGSRGCENLSSAETEAVTLLIPSSDYAGQTTSAHPEFFWYVSNSLSVPMEFTLVEPGKPEPLLVQRLKINQAGVVHLKVPPQAKALEIGKTYRWTVSLICNQMRPSANPLFYSWIERVALSPETTTDLEKITATENYGSQSLYQQAVVYGQKGLWYDALAKLMDAYQVNPLNSQIQNHLYSFFPGQGETRPLTWAYCPQKSHLMMAHE